jgi:hypothetical protein
VPKARLIGLGVTNSARKDSSNPFDGLGIVRLSRRKSGWNSYPGLFPLNEEDDEEGGEGCISDVMLQETLYTWMYDPMHRHVLTSIPECEEEAYAELEMVAESF